MKRAKKNTAKQPAKKHHEAGHSKKSVAARRARFIEEMMVNGENITAAAMVAGFSRKTAYSQGSRLMKNVDIQRVLAERRARLLNKFELTTEGVVRELARIAYFDLGKCYDKAGKLLAVHAIDEDTRRALAGAKDGELKAFNKPEALRSAMQYLGLIKRPQITAVAIAQSAAAAEVKQLEPEKRSMIEIARRVAFVLSQGARAVKPPPAGQKQPA